MELTTPTIFAIGVLAFICEYVDATLGMGYGTILTPFSSCWAWPRFRSCRPCCSLSSSRVLQAAFGTIGWET